MGCELGPLCRSETRTRAEAPSNNFNLCSFSAILMAPSTPFESISLWKFLGTVPLYIGSWNPPSNRYGISLSKKMGIAVHPMSSFLSLMPSFACMRLIPTICTTSPIPCPRKGTFCRDTNVSPHRGHLRVESKSRALWKCVSWVNPSGPKYAQGGTTPKITTGQWPLVGGMLLTPSTLTLKPMAGLYWQKYLKLIAGISFTGADSNFEIAFVMTLSPEVLRSSNSSKLMSFRITSFAHRSLVVTDSRTMYVTFSTPVGIQPVES
mmetsp:Transcript_11179/g.17568  ORF Transcript_11179/g.17568 Transcript_11179/m.17568 type:complete len:264 (-) Transcript_11179:43-834(-)